MTATETVKQKREDILRLVQARGASNPRLFGSLARGEAYPGSDLDLLVDLSPEASLLDLIALKQDVEALTGCRVDLVTAGSLSPYIRESVLRDAKPL